MKCPICKGSGKLKEPFDGDKRHDDVQLRAWQASVLRRKGYSIRQIQKQIGFKSQTSVTYLLNKYPLNKTLSKKR